MFTSFKPSSVSLKTRLAVIFGFGAMALAGFLCWIIGEISARQVEVQIGQSLLEIAYQVQDKLDRSMFERYRNIQIVAELDALTGAEMSLEARRNFLNKLKKTYSPYIWLGITDNAGTILVATDDSSEGASVSDQPWFQRGLRGPNVGDARKPLLDADASPDNSSESSRFIYIAAPVIRQDGAIGGVLGAFLDWKWVREIRESVRAPLEALNDIEILVLNDTGSVWLGPANLHDVRLTLASVKAARLGQSNYRVERWPDGETYLTGFSQSNGYRSYPGLRWTILVRQPIQLAYTPVYRLQMQILLWGAIAGLLFAAIGRFIARRLAAPLTVISQAAEQILIGNTAIRIPQVSGYSEVSDLSASLRALVQTLTQHEAALEVLNESLERRVEQRTVDLRQANEALQQEVRERRRAELEREQLINELKEMAETDALTGVLNRRTLFIRGHHELLRAKRLSSSLAVIILDVDHFKRVNDTYGHGVGDEIIRHVASRCQANLRKIDLFGRYGGEEFVIIAVEADSAMAQQLAERIRLAIADMRIPIDGTELSVTASFGVTVLTPEIVDLMALVNRADVALYRAKREGRDRVIAA